MYFELQFTQAKFLELLRDQVQRSFPAITKEFEVSGVKRLVDHLDSEGVTIDGTRPEPMSIRVPSGSIQVPGQVVMVKINIGANLTAREAVIAAGNFGVPNLEQFSCWIIADIRVVATSDGDIQLELVPTWFDTGIKNLVSNKTRQEVLASLNPPPQKISLPDIAGQSLVATNAGLVFHGDTIALRAELSAPSSTSQAEWTAFFAGDISILGNDWAIQLPPALVVEVVDNALTDSVDALAAKNKSSIAVVSEPDTGWEDSGPTSTATINAIGACPASGFDIRIDLDFSVGFGLQGADLQVTVDMRWTMNQADMFRCASLDAFEPVTILMPGIGVFAPAALIDPVLAITESIALIVAISDKAHGELSDGVSRVSPGEMNLHTVEKDKHHAVISGDVPLRMPLPGMTPTAVSTSLSGLVISGTYNAPAHQERSLVKIEQSSFGWRGSYSCSTRSWSASKVDASVRFRDPAPNPLEYQVDSLTRMGTYTIKNPHGAWSSGFGMVSAHALGPEGTAAECEFLLFTNSGVRFVDLGHLEKPPKPPPEQELVGLSFSCFKQRLPGPKKWLEVLWQVDPPPFEGLAELHVWDLLASQVPAGANVELAVVDGAEHTRSLTTVKADHRGHAAFRLVTERGEHVALSRADDSMALWAAGAAATQVARFVPRMPAVDVAVVGSGASARIALATQDQVLLFGLDGQGLGRARIPGVQHVAATGMRLAAHDRSRIVSMNVSSVARSLNRPAHAPGLRALRAPRAVTLAPTRSWSSGQEITGLEAHGGRLVASLRDGSKVTLDRHLSPAEEATHSARWLAAPWLRAPLRVGTIVARIEDGAVGVYRYRSVVVF